MTPLESKEAPNSIADLGAALPQLQEQLAQCVAKVESLHGDETDSAVRAALLLYRTDAQVLLDCMAKVHSILNAASDTGGPVSGLEEVPDLLTRIHQGLPRLLERFGQVSRLGLAAREDRAYAATSALAAHRIDLFKDIQGAVRESGAEEVLSELEDHSNDLGPDFKAECVRAVKIIAAGGGLHEFLESASPYDYSNEPGDGSNQSASDESEGT